VVSPERFPIHPLVFPEHAVESELPQGLLAAGLVGSRNLLEDGEPQALEVFVKRQAGDEVQVLRDDNIRYGIAQGDFSITAELTEGKESFRSDFGVDVDAKRCRRKGL